MLKSNVEELGELGAVWGSRKVIAEVEEVRVEAKVKEEAEARVKVKNMAADRV